MKTQRKFILGDEWIYYKIYLGEYASDLVLVDLISNISKKFIENKIIDKFFFIRYNENGYHIRVRFHLVNNSKISTVIDTFNKMIKESFEKNIIYKIQVDTYERELERYYGDCVIYSENIFYHDSLVTLEFLSALHKFNLDENYRWLFGIYSIDFLIKDFGFELHDRFKIMELLNESFSKEFNINKGLTKQLDSKFRFEKDKITQLLNDGNKDFESLLRLRSSNISDDIKKIKAKLNNDELVKILVSYIHMSCNRLFRSNPRKHEFVLYHFLWKYYRSAVGRISHQN
ncbi:thiopeptide-type bacteriocin biosynthesis protein [Flavobacterium sp. Arc3]|uniref:thiopeptide-type bacteriocin biosynthesis protein n=1 Tax=Flavobacterium sp. Arc3 TaxID=3046686 RepID=UPI00352F656B